MWYLPVIIMMIFIHPLDARSAELRLECDTFSSNNADERMLRVDRVVINLEKNYVHLISTSTGDDWVYTNKTYNEKLDWIDSIFMFRLRDGVVMASGIRGKLPFSFNYEPGKGVLVYSSAEVGIPRFINFRCKKL